MADRSIRRLPQLSLYENREYLTIYEDADYMVWVDTAKGVINIFLQAKGLTLHFSYEDFRDFRESLSAPTWADMDEDFSEEFSEVYMAERGIGLYFDREELRSFVDILNSLGVISEWSLCWN